MPQVVPNVSQIDLAVHHARACRVPQPMGRCLAQPLCSALVRRARRLQMFGRVVENLFDDEMHSTASQRPVCATDRQQQRCGFTTIRECSKPIVSAIAGQFRHQFGRHWKQTFLVAFPGDRQPPSILAFAIAPSKKSPIGLLTTSEMRRPFRYKIDINQRTRA